MNIFFLGFLGSLAINLLEIYHAYHGTRKTLPKKYKKFSSWVKILVLAIIGGFLAVAYEIPEENPMAAFQIGASTPLILDRFRRNRPPKLPLKTKENESEE